MDLQTLQWAPARGDSQKVSLVRACARRCGCDRGKQDMGEKISNSEKTDCRGACPAAGQSIARARYELTNCIQALEVLSDLTEVEFLAVGSHLRDLHARALALMDACEQAMSRMEDLCSQTLDGLHAIGADLDMPVDVAAFQAAREAIATCAGGVRHVRDAAAELRRSIAESLSRISDDVHAIVIFLQFHDITRQQFEKSHAKLSAMMNGSEATPDNPSPLRDVVSSFCAGQTRTLVHTRDEFMDAANQVVKSLQRIARECGAVSSAVAGLGARTHKKNSSVFGDCASTLSGMGQVLRENSAAAEHRPPEDLRGHASHDALFEVIDAAIYSISDGGIWLEDAMTNIEISGCALVSDLERVASMMTIHVAMDEIIAEVIEVIGRTGQAVGSSVDGDSAGDDGRKIINDRSDDSNVELF